MEMPTSVISGLYDFTICVWFNSYRDKGDLLSVATSGESNWIVFNYYDMYHDGDSEEFGGCS